MAADRGPFDWLGLQAAVLAGQGLSNETASLLLPGLSAEADQHVATLEDSGALLFLREAESPQVRQWSDAAPTHPPTEESTHELHLC